MLYILALLPVLIFLFHLIQKQKKKAIEELKWMIEEYKVSLFAQEIKTAFPISVKRLEKKLQEIERMI